MRGYLSPLAARMPSGERLGSLLAVGLVCAVVVAHAIFVALSVLPQTRMRRSLLLELESTRRALADSQSARAGSEQALRQRIAGATAGLDAAADVFMSEAQAAEMPARLYEYAKESGVQIASLQGQPAQRAGGKGLYDVRSLHVQATGSLPGLLAFVSRMRQATPRGLTIASMSVTRKEGRYDLAMELVLHTSPYAPKAAPTSALAVAPTPNAAHPSPSPTAPPATSTPEPVPTAQPPPPPTPTPSPRFLVHTVRPGDTLYSLARRHGTTVQAIMAANNLGDHTIRVGQQLYIPVR